MIAQTAGAAATLGATGRVGSCAGARASAVGASASLASDRLGARGQGLVENVSTARHRDAQLINRALIVSLQFLQLVLCFCFTDQRLKAGETRDMAVVFFVAPDIVKDSEQDGVETITLSYTMYPARQTEPVRGENGAAAGRS